MITYWRWFVTPFSKLTTSPKQCNWLLQQPSSKKTVRSQPQVTQFSINSMRTDCRNKYHRQWTMISMKKFWWRRYLSIGPLVSSCIMYLHHLCLHRSCYNFSSLIVFSWYKLSKATPTQALNNLSRCTNQILALWWCLGLPRCRGSKKRKREIFYNPNKYKCWRKPSLATLTGQMTWSLGSLSASKSPRPKSTSGTGTGSVKNSRKLRCNQAFKLKGLMRATIKVTSTLAGDECPRSLPTCVGIMIQTIGPQSILHKKTLPCLLSLPNPLPTFKCKSLLLKGRHKKKGKSKKAGMSTPRQTEDSIGKAGSPIKNLINNQMYRC